MLLGYFFSYINHRFLLKNKICKPFWNNKANLTIYQIIYQNPCWWLLDYVNVGIVVQSLSCGWLFAIPWTTACQASLSFTISQSLLKRLFIVLVVPSNHLILRCPLLLVPSIFPSIRVFSSELALHTRQPKHWSFSFSLSPSNEYSLLISFKADWFDLAVQGTVNSLLQHHSSKASVI